MVRMESQKRGATIRCRILWLQRQKKIKHPHTHPGNNGEDKNANSPLNKGGWFKVVLLENVVGRVVS